MLPPLPNRTLFAAFTRILASTPDKVAHICGTQSFTFAQAYERSMRYAGGLARHGVQRGEAVAALLDNHVDTAHLYFGLGLVGMIQTPVNSAFKGIFLSHILNDSRASVLVIESAYCERLLEIADEVPHLKTVIVRGPMPAKPPAQFKWIDFDELQALEPAEPVEMKPWDIQGYFYTSGTSGPSKGVRVTYAQAYTFASREDDPRSSSEERSLVVMPLFHVAGQLYCVYQALIAGSCCVIEPVFSVSAFWRRVREERISTVLMVGAMGELLLQQPPREDDSDNPLELLISAPLMTDVHSFAKRFNVNVGVVYGITEFGCPILGRPEQVIGGECGFAREGFACKVVDENDIEVPRGTVGELVIRADVPWTLCDGYLGNPEATANQRRNLWAHTGDAFRQDDSGRFYFVDRIKDAIRRRGENVSSFEVEGCVNRFPAVLESAVVGVPSTVSEDEILVYIVCRPGHALDPAELTRFLASKMPYFTVPRFVEVVDELPKTQTNKVRKNVLRSRGLTSSTWDRVAAGVIVDRHS